MSQAATLYRVSKDTFEQKGKDNTTIELINEIFNPKQALGGQEIERLPPEEQFEFYESGLFILLVDVFPIIKFV